MARRKRPNVTDYLDGLDQPAVATSRRKGKAQTAPLPTATTGKRRKITLYFREALLEEGAQRRRAFSALPVEATGRAAARGKLVNEDEGSERARVKRARDIKATDSFLLRITVLFAALVGAIVFHACAQRYEFVPNGTLFRTDRLTGEACPWHYREQRCRGQGTSL